MRMAILLCLLIVGLLFGLYLIRYGKPEHGNQKARVVTANRPAHDDLLIDSKLTLEQAIGNQQVPQSISSRLTLVTVRYYAFDGKLHQGQLVADRRVANDLASIFTEIATQKFPIARVIPVSHYHNSDDLSMADNNTSCFNYRFVPGTHHWSLHALGKAIDINPLFNPFIDRGSSKPLGASYNPNIPGTITSSCALYKAFHKRGWFWGGKWQRMKDYQHFQKM